MGNPSARSVRVSFVGNNVDATEISQILGAPPSRGAKMGRPVDFLDGRPLATKGLWELREAVGDDPADLARAINALFGALTADRQAWSEVTRRYGGASLTYSIPVANAVEGVGLPAEIVREIADRGLSFGVAVYQDRR